MDNVINKIKNRGSGFGLLDIVYLGILVVVAIYFIYKIGVPYYDNYVFKRVAVEKAKELGPDATEKELINAIQRGLSTENISAVPINELTYESDGGVMYVNLEYSVERNITDDVFIKVNFNVHEGVK